MSILKTGLSGTYKPSFASLDGNCYCCNGFDRSMSYNGVTVTNMGIRMTGSAMTQSAQSADGSMATTGVYKFRMEYYNQNKGYCSGWSSSVTITLTGSNTAVTLNVLADSSIDSQVTHARIYRTTNGGNIYYLDSSSTGGLVAFTGTATTYKSTVADSALTTVMGELNAAENANVNIHTAPPTCPYICVHEGRLLMTGKIKYTTGTVTMAASTTVEGSGTAWTQGMVGFKFLVDDDNRVYEISSVTDADTKVLTETYGGTTGAGKSYTIYGPNGSFIWYSYITTDGYPRPESVPTTYWFQVDRDSNDENTGLQPIRNGTLLSRWNSLWLISGSTPAQISIPHKVSGPTGFAPHTMANDDDMNVIGTGEQGIYITDGVITKDLIATTIKNIFSGKGSPPWEIERSRLKYAHAVFIDKRYYVWIASSSSTYENKCIVLDFNVPMQDGSPSPTVFDIPADCSRIVEDSNRHKWIYFGSKGFTNYIDDDATNDGAGSTSTVRGTVTSATSTVITDTSATFTDDILGCRVKILSGTAVGETGFISARTATTFTVETAFSTTAVAGDVYAIGYITAYRKTKFFDFGQILDKTIRRIKMIYKKQSTTYSMYLKHYTNFSTTQTGTTKYIDMSKDARYHSTGLDKNRAMHHQFEFGIDDCDKPFQLREIEMDILYHGKVKETAEKTS